MATPQARATPALASAVEDSLRLVLFGVPGAGKSSLLGALGAAAQTQEHLLHGRLNDLSHGLAALQVRLYEQTPQATAEELVPYPIAFEPFDSGTDEPVSAVLFDCDGRVAHNLLTRTETLANGVPPGELAAAVGGADALILTVDCSAAPEQLTDEFETFERFLRELEQHRGTRVDTGGLPTFLVLTKCDLLAQPGDTTVDWMERIEQRKREVGDHFRAFLAQRTGARGSLPFGQLELHLWATAVKRPTLAGAAGRPREPYGVAELFRQSLDRAADYRRRCQQSSRRLLWMSWSAAAVLSAFVFLALFLGLRPVPKPPSEVQLALEALQFNEKPNAAERLGAPLVELRLRREHLRQLQDDPGFAALPENLRMFAISRYNELDKYIEWLDQLDAVPRPVTVDTEAALQDIKSRLEKLEAQVKEHEEWDGTEGVRLYHERLDNVNELLNGVHLVEAAYLGDPDKARNLEAFTGYRKDTGVDWRTWSADLETLRRQFKTIKQTDKLPGSTTLTYAAVMRFDMVNDALVLRQRLERERNLAAALGLIGPFSDCPPLLVFDKTPVLDLAAVKKRWDELQTSYPHYKTDFTRDDLPELLRREVARAAETNYEALLEPARARVLSVWQNARGDDKARWDAVREWLLGDPEELAAWRSLANLLAHLFDPHALDPVTSLAAFLEKTTFSLEVQRITLDLPDNLRRKVRPTAALSIYHPRTKQTGPALVLEQAKTAEPREGSLVFELKKAERLVYLPGDDLWVTLPLSDDKELTWARNRSPRFQFERLLKPPRLHKDGEDNTKGELIKEGVRVRFEPADGWPRVPDLLPVVP